jgi:dissimilatory sulfite reductase (desulfoviridin) alpha/beta subunit
VEIFKRKCPRCLKAVPFRGGEERAGGQLRITTVACTSCGVVLGVLPYMGRYPEKREMESMVGGIVKKHLNAAVKKLRKPSMVRGIVKKQIGAVVKKLRTIAAARTAKKRRPSHTKRKRKQARRR